MAALAGVAPFEAVGRKKFDVGANPLGNARVGRCLSARLSGRRGGNGQRPSGKAKQEVTYETTF